MKKHNKVIPLLLTSVMALTAGGWTGSIDVAAKADEKLDYTYGVDETFHSNDVVRYSSMFSDHENYPYQKSWRFYSGLQELTNVDLATDLIIAARVQYEDQKSLLINSGDAPYIIPKCYGAGSFPAGGQVVAISDWVQYMPNYMNNIEKWDMESDLQQIRQFDGKYYYLPGLWESVGGGYSYMIRKDVFEEAGIDVTKEEAGWTYEDFYEVLKKVREHTGAKYVFSDQFEGKSALSIGATVYGANAGWGIGSGTKFDFDKEEFYFTAITDGFKEYLTYFNKLISEGLMDPESFTQSSETALNKFYKGESFVISANPQNLEDARERMQVKDYELYMIVQPGGPSGFPRMTNSRFENGLMISTNALKELGEEKFIKMLRFVDWLWYSEEGLTYSSWGIEGETYTLDKEGNVVLDPDISYSGFNLDTATKKLNVDFGYAGGNYAYGGSVWLKLSKATGTSKDYEERTIDLREARPLDPPVMGTVEETEDMNLIFTPLKDYVETMTLKFITGQENIETGWDNFVNQCVKTYKADKYVNMRNEIFDRTKESLGF